jgi:predicted RNA-binding protein with TRAM domain
VNIVEDSGTGTSDVTKDVPDVGDVYRNAKIVATGVNKDGSPGDGVFKTPGGFVIFVAGSKKDDVVDIRVRRVFSKYAFADIIKAE